MPIDQRLISPFNLMISGPSQSGKSHWIEKFLTYKELLIDIPPQKIFLIYSIFQPAYERMTSKNLIDKVIRGLPEDYLTIENMVMPYRDHGGSMIIIDDGLKDLNVNVVTMCEQLSNNANCSVIFVTQNLFVDSPIFRRISKQSHYICLMPNPRNRQELRALAMQISFCNPKYVYEAYDDAIKMKRTIDGKVGYGYLLFDLKVSVRSNPICKLRTNIFPNELDPLTIYKEREC